MLGRGVDPQTLLFDSQPTEVASTRPRDYRQNVKLFEQVYEGSIL